MNRPAFYRLSRKTTNVSGNNEKFQDEFFVNLQNFVSLPSSEAALFIDMRIDILLTTRSLCIFFFLNNR